MADRWNVNKHHFDENLFTGCIGIGLYSRYLSRRWSGFQPHRGWISNQRLEIQLVVGNPPMVGEYPTTALSWPWCSGDNGPRVLSP